MGCLLEDLLLKTLSSHAGGLVGLVRFVRGSRPLSLQIDGSITRAISRPIPDLDDVKDPGASRCRGSRRESPGPYSKLRASRREARSPGSSKSRSTSTATHLSIPWETTIQRDWRYSNGVIDFRGLSGAAYVPPMDGLGFVVFWINVP